jgi:flagellar hook protein FlgE
MNTPGYKTSEVAFRDMVTQSIGSTQGETQIGLGTGVPLTIREFTQGAIQTGAGALDAAIQGSGFFVTQNSQGNTMYTRAGNFQVDKSGNLLTATGDQVQGWTAVDPATGQVDTSGSIGNIVVPTGALRPPSATTTMSVDMNLNSSAAADATSNFSTPITAYDSLGTSHVLTMNFQKTGTNTWSYQVSVPGADVTAGTAGTPFALAGASGTLTFDSNGQLTTPAAGSPIDVKIPGLADGASDMDVSWDPYSGSTSRITQFGQPSATAASAQNGNAPAQLVSVGLADGGSIVAQYSNGQQVTVGEVAMASIRNPQSLIAVGNNDFQLSSLTANPSIGTPGTGGRGTIVGGAIEASTVDMATEFTNLIVYQRGYEANAHVVTTADQLTQDTINLMH